MAPNCNSYSCMQGHSVILGRLLWCPCLCTYNWKKRLIKKVVTRWPFKCKAGLNLTFSQWWQFIENLTFESKCVGTCAEFVSLLAFLYICPLIKKSKLEMSDTHEYIKITVIIKLIFMSDITCKVIYHQGIDPAPFIHLGHLFALAFILFCVILRQS